MAQIVKKFDLLFVIFEIKGVTRIMETNIPKSKIKNTVVYSKLLQKIGNCKA